MDNSTLERWRGLDCVAVLNAVADHVKADATFVPRKCHDATRWHISAAGNDFELLCTGAQFFDTRARRGGGGAVDLVMHLFQVDFRCAVSLLREKGIG